MLTVEYYPVKQKTIGAGERFQEPPGLVDQVFVAA